MPARSITQRSSERTLRTAELLRQLLSRWVRTTRERAGTPSSARIETLRLLEDRGPASIAALAQRRAVKHQSMRLVVEQLATEGAVQKTTGATDRRNQIVSITDAGRALVAEEQRTRTAWIAALLQSCSPAEQAEVQAAMTTLGKLLDRTPDKAGETL